MRIYNCYKTAYTCILISIQCHMKKLVFVTQNMNKIADAQKLLPEFEIEHVDFEIPEIQSLDPNEIIEYKLEYAYKKVNIPCFVMDSSLSLDCLNGFPGPLIKWFEKAGIEGEKTCQIANLFNEHGCAWTNVLGYYDGQDTHFFTETLKGALPDAPRGTNGYCWDPIFIPDGETRTFAEMTFDEKRSHIPAKKIFNRFHTLVTELGV